MSKKTASYTKLQFLQSASYTPVQKDVLNALLQEDKTYSKEEVTKLLDQFMKRKVN